MKRSQRKTMTFTDSRYRIRYQVEGPYAVDGGRSRFLHGPCVIQCLRGDWIVAYQDALDDPGRESVIRQRRSTDGGVTWTDEGIIYEETRQGFGARNPAFGQTPEGKILMVIQRVGLRRLGVVRGENIMGSKLLISRDCGHTYENRGSIDRFSRRGHQGCSTHIVYHHGKLLMPAYHPQGLALYISADEGETWPERIVLVKPGEVPERPTYPTVAARPDGSLLMIGHLNKAVRCFGRISLDDGRTWGPLLFFQDLTLRHPVLGYVGETMICVGRNMKSWKPALCVSPDHGRTWSDLIDLAPDRSYGGGYTAPWPSREPGRVFVAFSTDGARPFTQDILGLFLSKITIQPVK